MLTIIIAITPVPRCRSGFQSAASFSQPNAAGDDERDEDSHDHDRHVGAADADRPGSWSTA